jgi:hypothetical protein
MSKIFYFGEKIKGFDVRVLNEREIRAGAGILFFFAILSFSNAWLTGNFYPTKLFVIAFLIDFFIRIFINPKYAPSLIVGRFIVNNQDPEYVGAPQKKFAWVGGFVLGITMFFVAIVNNIMGPVNLLICLTCLTLLFFETSFGICLGCKAYNKFNKEKAKLCPGGSCDIKKKVSIQKITLLQVVSVIIFLGVIALISYSNLMKGENKESPQQETSAYFEQKDLGVVSDECIVPDWAKKIGHEEKYKQHHGCN